MCKKMTAHWEEKDHWLPPESKNGWDFPEKKEIWDGKRFAELSYFWDPTQGCSSTVCLLLLGSCQLQT